MAEKLDPRQLVTFEELLRAMMFETEATRRVLVRKGLLTNEEVLEEIKAVRREMEGTRRNPTRGKPLREADRRHYRSRQPLRGQLQKIALPSRRSHSTLPPACTPTLPAHGPREVRTDPVV